MKHLATLLCLCIPALAPAADPVSPKALIESYCVNCHGAETRKGKVRLDDSSRIEPPLWKTIYEQLATHEMPPVGKPQPKAEERKNLMDHALLAATKGTTIAAPGFRRLNQREYGNTVRDLLGLRKGTFDPGKYIYVDEVKDGFDTEAKELVISNELLLEYLDAAKKSLDQALFTGETDKPAVRIVNVAMKTMDGIGGNRYITASKDHMIMRNGGHGMVFASKRTRAMTTPGRYTITVTAAGVDRDRYPVRFTPATGPIVMGFGVKRDGAESVGQDHTLQKSFELKDNVDQTFTFDVWIDKGYFPYFSFVNGPGKPITQIRAGIRRGSLPRTAMSQPYIGPAVRISGFKIEGPFHDVWPPESYRTTFDAAEIPDLANASDREKSVERFATRAFRRPVTKEELAPYLRYLDKQYAETENWHKSVVRTFAAMMGSMDFLFLREESGELNAHALANRLSYFLWSTMPDAELFALAQSGKLKDPTVLKAQVSRMLADPRSNRFGDSFTDQWLALKTLGSMPPDAKSAEFRIYYRDHLESAMREETHRYFRHVLSENRSVLDFIDSDYSFINAGLADLYKVPFAGGKNEFVRTTFPPTAHRGGLLGHASILTLSANGVETSPVERGVWVLKHLLGTPPPPPPKEVPALVPDLNGSQTVRELLAKHRSDASCMECHRRIDPPGFALEAYDPIGRFRTNYTKTMPVSTEGEYKGKPFKDVTSLKKLMLDEPRSFARSLVVRIAEYAKGRKLVAGDLKTVEAILDQVEKDEFRLKDIIMQLATSDLMKRR
jgi:Protein of unknown function (DUF1592)/Protein of unknown function (DUF1588)/Protein of unknown function (DUF1587)/Protein of unknown function (DUF1585)/Protein of unknown function (DUF1595)